MHTSENIMTGQVANSEQELSSKHPIIREAVTVREDCRKIRYFTPYSIFIEYKMSENGSVERRLKLLPLTTLLILLGIAWSLAAPNTFNDKCGVQKVVPKSRAFPCNTAHGRRGKTIPSSVHQLRPGDIDVVAAIGDSLTAGTGAVASSFLDILTMDNRGMSWVAGGQGTWRKYLTLPNILKVYNSKLVGYSTGDGRSHTKNAQFNVAVNGAMDQDLIYEAKELVRRLKNDKRVDYKKNWKLISIWVGTNDLCSDFCHDPTQGVNTHIKNLEATIDYLYQHVPKAYVMLVSSPFVPSYAKLRDMPSVCNSILPIVCSCLYGGDMQSKLNNVTQTARLFQQAEQVLAASKKYQGREDFTVEFQPTFLESNFPMHKNEKGQLTTDYSYLSVDCFHYSQKLHAVAANTVWNNLFETPNNKTTTWRPAFEKFECPTEEQPFLVTRKNSNQEDLVLLN